MKKKLISIMALLLSASLMMACNFKKPIPTPSSNPSSNPSSGDSSNNEGEQYGPGSDDGSSVIPSEDSSSDISSDSIESSDSSGSSDIVPVVDPDSLDGILSQFFNDADVKVPALNSYNLDYQVFYYLAYEEYIVYAEGDDVGGLIESEYLAKFDNADTGFVSANDDDYYTVEEYGYLFTDEADGNANLNFYTQYDTFFFTATRYDGDAGALDVSDVDTSWYVDYYNIYGMDLATAFPADLIKQELGLASNLVIPGITASEYPASFEEEQFDEEGNYVPNTFKVIFEGDKLNDYVNVLKNAGYTAEIVENEGYDIDWDNWEVIEYTYYTATAYDSNKEVYITIETDSYENTVVKYYKFTDLFSTEKTTNTDWTDEEKALMDEILKQRLPFMAFGEDYEVYDYSDDDYNILCVADYYFEDLTQDYIDILLANGFKEDNTSYSDVCYYYDDGVTYVEVFVDYAGGNYLEVYSEDSHYGPLDALSFKDEAIDIVAGATYQLEPIYVPSTATHPVIYSSSNEDIATVDQNGLVTIKEDAAIDSSVVITATTAGGKTASCSFTVKDNIVTGIAVAKDTYYVIPGEERYPVDYYLLPIGVTSDIGPGFSLSSTSCGIHCDVLGRIWADADAVPGTSITIIANHVHFQVTFTVVVAEASVTDTLTGTFFGIKKGETTYSTYTKNVENGASYEAQAAAGSNADGGNGLQLRSKNSNSGVIGHFEGRTCKSITVTFDANTGGSGSDRAVDIYASNEPFTIADMYGSMTKVGSLNFDSKNLTQTYTFTAQYSYIGFRSADGAVYLVSVDVVW